jgi:rhamnopyranosyl-N-acetylglucosaminyl-diphospho-decaprenol beta-1,3/1,4-galactofuranosyltransferase
MPEGAPRVWAVVVTYNRRDLLAQALGAVISQTHPVAGVVVVDNASTDATAEMVARDFPDAHLVELAANTGGAGGFAAGIGVAQAFGPELIWAMDDDTVPHEDALAELVRARQRYPGPSPVLLASRVVWTDGRDHPMNTPRTWGQASPMEVSDAAAVGARPIRSASFVSVLLDASTVAERGLPVADYFLWNDDFEFSTRLIRGRRAIAVPTSVVVHHTRVFGDTAADPGDRFYYEVRNKIWLFTRSRSLGSVEKLLFGAATGRRWVRTAVASSDRCRLGRAFARGLRDGVLTEPRPTNDVLMAAGLVPAFGTDEWRTASSAGPLVR